MTGSRAPRRARAPSTRKRRIDDDAPPPVAVVDVIERDGDGELYVRMVKSSSNGPTIRLVPTLGESLAGAPGLGDRLLVRFESSEMGEREARLIKRLGQSAHRVLGVVRKARREIRVEPVDRRSKESLLLTDAEGRDLSDGDLVLAQVGGNSRASARAETRQGARSAWPRGRTPRRLLVAIHTHGLPVGFSDAAEAEALSAKPATLEARTDLRDLPLITIDPADARDHDDAVFAEADVDPANPGGWIAWVAIADVAAYVRPGSAIDREAWEKGNSVYFPDRAASMLLERPLGRSLLRRMKASRGPASPCGWCSTPKAASEATVSFEA